MIDLLQIPGTWRRPNPSIPSHDQHPFDASPRDVTLYIGGEVDWQFREGRWSSSGHWKIVKGTYLSVVVVYPDPVAAARGESFEEFYYRLIAVDDRQITVRDVLLNEGPDQFWARVAPAREFAISN